MGRPEPTLSPECYSRLRSYHWPGNIRELQNVIERAMITAVNGQLDVSRALPLNLLQPQHETTQQRPEEGHVLTVEELRVFEGENIRRALARCDWKVAGETGAARLLGLPASTLTSRMKALGIKRPI
jgi:transcriptional regulator with GAF, ATPase, and Fis domain